MTTEEVAAMVPGVAGSGFSNADLEAQVRETLTETYGPGVTEEMVGATSASLLVGAAFAAQKAIREGQIDKRELKAAMGDLGVGLTTALVLDVILTGG